MKYSFSLFSLIFFSILLNITFQRKKVNTKKQGSLSGDGGGVSASVISQPFTGVKDANQQNGNNNSGAASNNNSSGASSNPANQGTPVLENQVFLPCNSQENRVKKFEFIKQALSKLKTGYLIMKI